MRYGKVIVQMENGNRKVYQKVWVVRDIIDKDREDAKRICFFDGSEMILKEKDIKSITYL